jgi:hypothetical protein
LIADPVKDHFFNDSTDISPALTRTSSVRFRRDQAASFRKPPFSCAQFEQLLMIGLRFPDLPILRTVIMMIKRDPSSPSIVLVGLDLPQLNFLSVFRKMTLWMISKTPYGQPGSDRFRRRHFLSRLPVQFLTASPKLQAATFFPSG